MLAFALLGKKNKSATQKNERTNARKKESHDEDDDIIIIGTTGK